MPIADQIPTSDPTRHKSGYSAPNFQAPSPPALGEHSWLAPHERSQYFEANPRQAFQAHSSQFGVGQQKRGIMGGLNDIMDTYLGNLGRNVMSGERAPEGGFGDFLAGTRGYDSPFDFQGWYRENNPGVSERNDARFDPSVRYLF